MTLDVDRAAPWFAPYRDVGEPVLARLAATGRVPTRDNAQPNTSHEFYIDDRVFREPRLASAPAMGAVAC